MRKHLKIGIISLICIILFSSTAAIGQVKPAEASQSVASVLTALAAQYKVNFLYEEANVTHQKVKYHASLHKGKSITEVLNSLLVPLNLSWYKVDVLNYSIFPKPAPTVSNTKQITALKLLGQDSLVKDQVRGRVLDEHQKPLAFTTVTLLTAIDSSLVENALTDPDGNFNFTAIKAGTYKIRISTIGKYPYTTKPFTVGGAVQATIEPIAMRASEETLKEVKITSTRPLVETKSDRLIFNVENSAMATGNSLQLLRSAPFVRISVDNSVSLQGKKTMILIDGKPVPDVSLENILQTMPAGNIQKLELITQPSAKYDASYGAVINIITKKSQIEGFTGNFRVDASTGKYANGSTNLSATYKRNRLTVYANGGIIKGDNLFGVTSARFQDPTEPAYYMSNNWTRLSHNNMFSVQASIDYQLGNNQTIGFFADANIFRFEGPWATRNEFGRQNAMSDSVSLTGAVFNQKANSSTYNLNYHLMSDSGKNDLTMLATFTPWQRNMFQSFPSTLYNGAGNLIRTPAIYQTRNKGAIDVYIGQADYIHQFNNRWKFETGIKFQKTNSTTSVYYEDDRSGQMQQVSEFSSQNTLQESIGAVYGIFSVGWTNVKLQGGVRLEDTRANFGDHFRQQYTNIFPTLLYQHKLSKVIDLSASYKKTISRAPYYELVPYIVFINQYTIEQGNPALTPGFDNIYALNANVNKLNLSVSYTRNKGLIGLFPVKQDVTTKVTYFTRQNLKSASDISLYLFYPLQINNWWQTINSGTPIGYNQAGGMVLGQQYKLSALHSDFKTSHIFKFSSKLKIQVDAYYWTDYVQDLSHNTGNKNVDASFLLSLWEGKGQMRLGGNELVFKRNDYLISRDYGSFRSAERVNTDSKRIYLGFTYKFGKSHINKNEAKLGNEDALKRL
ncbi:outer membrane beta-barrel protein [Pedobacter sp. JCM 36344]|uniref:outer membrane beta-barrel protein n=1 Tax=Pedobacter sp. JCM 36344 TaxID=3374280 RepID=UPI00397CF3C6